MPKLTTSDNSKITKLLLIGDSGTGKTGALASLVKAGYSLGVLDMDNKLQTGILPKLLTPEEMDRVSFMTFRDKKKWTPSGPVVSGLATAFAGAMKAMDKWEDDSKPAEWGPQKVFVLDSSTFLADAAFDWAVGMNPTCKDPRQWYHQAQQAFEAVISMVTDAAFHTNVIVIAHVTWTERQDGTTKGYPSAVGKALGPTIPAYFDNMLLVETSGAGDKARRTIKVAPTALVDVKTPGRFKEATLPVETGLADFFKEVRS